LGVVANIVKVLGERLHDAVMLVISSNGLHHASSSPKTMAWRPDPYIEIVIVEGEGDQTMAAPFFAPYVVEKDTPAGFVL